MQLTRSTDIQASAKQADAVQRLQRELEDALESRDREVRRADSDRREMARLQERIVALEAEQQSLGHNVRRTMLKDVCPFEHHYSPP